MTETKPCSHDNCPSTNVKADAKTNCSKCNGLVHLPCIGINVKFAEINSPHIKIFCIKCTTEMSNAETQADLNETFNTTKMTPKTKAKKITIENIIGEMNKLKNVVETNGKKLDNINARTEDIFKATPRLNKMFNTQNTPKQSFADALRNSGQFQSVKRKRTEFSKGRKNLPKPVNGKKTNFSGLTVVPKVKRPERQTFTKAVWVSRLEPIHSAEDITEYIINNTQITEKTQFNVHKLVKKDRDINTLKFVSFKIEVNDENFGILMDPEIWPEDVMVREFMQNKKLGDYFPEITPKNRKTPTEKIDLIEQKTAT